MKEENEHYFFFSEYKSKPSISSRIEEDNIKQGQPDSSALVFGSLKPENKHWQANPQQDPAYLPGPS